MLLHIVNFLVSFLFLILLISLLFVLIRDFSSAKKRLRNTIYLVVASLGYVGFMLLLWALTWVGAKPY